MSRVTVGTAEAGQRMTAGCPGSAGGVHTPLMGTTTDTEEHGMPAGSRSQTSTLAASMLPSFQTLIEKSTVSPITLGPTASLLLSSLTCGSVHSADDWSRNWNTSLAELRVVIFIRLALMSYAALRFGSSRRAAIVQWNSCPVGLDGTSPPLPATSKVITSLAPEVSTVTLVPLGLVTL